MKNSVKLIIAMIALTFASSPAFALSVSDPDSIETGVDTGSDSYVVGSPTFSPTGGYQFCNGSSVSVTISKATASDQATAICYSLTGTAPDCSDNGSSCDTGTLYSTPLTFSSATTITAHSCYPDGTEAESSASYSTKSCGGGGGGSGGVSTASYVEVLSAYDTTVPEVVNPYDLPVDMGSTGDDTLIISTQDGYDGVGMLDEGDDAGSFTRNTILENYDDSLTAEFELGTKVTDENGDPFTGDIAIPTISQNPPPSLEGGLIINAILMGSQGEKLFFDKPVTITIQIPEGTDTKNLKIYSYNEETGEYELVGNGGQVSADGKSISVSVTHMTLYVAMALESGPLYDSQFADVSSDHWAYDEIEDLRMAGFLGGYKDADGNYTGVFGLNDNITRAELLAIVLNASDFSCDLNTSPTSIKFGDVELSAWYAPYVKCALDNGIVKGYESDNTFRPNNDVTRAEAVAIILNGLKFQITESTFAFTDTADNWYTSIIGFAFEQRIVNGYKDGSFKPNNSISRAEAATIIHASLKKLGLI